MNYKWLPMSSDLPRCEIHIGKDGVLRLETDKEVVVCGRVIETYDLQVRHYFQDGGEHMLEVYKDVVTVNDERETTHYEFERVWE